MTAAAHADKNIEKGSDRPQKYFHLSAKDNTACRSERPRTGENGGRFSKKPVRDTVSKTNDPPNGPGSPGAYF